MNFAQDRRKRKDLSVVSDSACSISSHAVGTTDAASGGVPVKLAPFEQTPNSGGEYKVTLVRKNAPGVPVEDDGRNLDYPKAAPRPITSR